MLKTYLYLPEELKIKVMKLADAQNKSKASIMRTALQEGLYIIQKQKSGSAQSLLELGKIGERHGLKGPKDLSKNLDKYVWDEYEV